MTPIRAALIFWIMAIVFLGGLGIFSLSEMVAVSNEQMFLPPTNALLQKLIIIVCLATVLFSVQMALLFWAVCARNEDQAGAARPKPAHPDQALLDLNVLTDYLTGTLVGDLLLSCVVILGGVAAFTGQVELTELIGGLLVLCGLVLVIQPFAKKRCHNKPAQDEKEQTS